MAIIKYAKPYIQQARTINAADFYSRPALGPLLPGCRTTSKSTKTFEYTLKQMAVSPFSVNSRAYMNRIREETGIGDENLYDTFGTIGGVVGAGVGALFGSGLLKLPRYEGGLQFWKQRESRPYKTTN